MDDILRLVVCSSTYTEVEEIIRQEGWQDVTVEYYPRMCGDPRRKAPAVRAELKDLQGRENVVVINCQRMQPGLAAENFHQVPQCFNMLVNASLVDDALKRGYYILTPGWLEHWQQNLAAWGLDQPTARQFFQESMSGLLLLDTGLDERNQERLKEMGTYLQIQVSSQPVGLDYLRMVLYQIVSDWRNHKTLKRIEALNAEAGRSSADYAMVIDLLTHLTQARSEEEVHTEIADLFTMLFSLGRVVYYPLEDGHLLQTQSHSLDESGLQTLQNWLINSREPFTYTSSGKGFYLRIEHFQQTLGVLLADDLSLPQYMDQYLNLSLMIAGLCGLSIDNARNLQKLQQAEAEARREKEIAEALHSAMSDLASELGQEDLLERILVSLHRVIPFSIALVYLISGEDMAFRSGLHINPSGSFEPYQPTDRYMKIHIPWLKSVPLTLEDIPQIPELAPYLNTSVVRSWIGLPLMQQGRTIGFLSISSQRAGAYTRETVALAQAFGAEVSIALENARLFAELREAAITDSLTGLYNRRRFYELASIEFARSQRYKRPLSAVMLDIDFFKKVNDTHGHLAGDQVLKWFSGLCLQNMRGADIIGRYGGEEFSMLLPETDLEHAVAFAERLRELVASRPAPTGKGSVPVTCSLGIASMTRSTKDLEQLLDQSDAALYQAKRSGRNRVCSWDGEECSPQGE